MTNRIKGLDGGSIGPGSGNPIEKISVSKPVTAVALRRPRSPIPTASTLRSPPDHSRRWPRPSRTLLTSTMAASWQYSKQIESGQYTVNPDRIASRLLQLEQDLHGANSQ